MFEQPIFEETRVDVMHDLMQSYPFAMLTSHVNGALNADHLPLVAHTDEGEFGVLRGHIAVANPLWRARATGEVLVAFQGPQTYVTPSWYPSKAEHGKVVPTWNYAVVHARGSLVFHQDDAWLHAHLASLTDIHEGRRAAPWAVTDAPADFMGRQMKGIVGIEIAITELTGKWKMSQNKADADKSGVRNGLLADGQSNLADMVSRHVS